MARRWIPNEAAPISPNENIGRRLFNYKPLAGARDQKAPDGLIDLRHFEESRVPFELSLDRVGRSSFEPKVAKWLEPKACKAGLTCKPPKPFGGWLVAPARLLMDPPKGRGFPLIVSPERPTEPDHPEYNPYHAHIASPADWPIEHGNWLMAVAIRTLFERDSNVHLVSSEHEDSSAKRPVAFRISILIRAWYWLRSRFG